jgi:subtilase family serine protease
MLKPTVAQQSAIDRLLEQQQDKNSPLYHRWLTPEQYADQFGRSTEEISRVTSWLESSGFSIVRVARGRDYIVFSGTSAQVETVLHTAIHRYNVNGELHYANAAEPAVPEELADLVAGFRGLNDFHPKPNVHACQFAAKKTTGSVPSPQFIAKKYPAVNMLAPDDLATIYDVKKLSALGYDGTGQYVAIAGQSAIDPTDIEAFRLLFSLPFNDPVPILISPSQVFDPDAEIEADLDLEWAGAMAPNATIFYVYGQDALDAAFYTIDNIAPPVLSTSFGICERQLALSDIQFLALEAQKAALEGITWLSASGDSGAAGCEDANGNSFAATTGLSVAVPASLPWVTGVGGTEFSESNGSYFSNTLDPYLGSALSYIPESGWSDELALLQASPSGFAASGGGASAFFAKPIWQVGVGVPNDGARDVPDVALTASAFHDPYFLYSGGGYGPVGGTSASTPVFAGIVTLLNQVTQVVLKENQPGAQGNFNPFLYAVAQIAPHTFHDIIAGNNIVPCIPGSTNDCTTGFIGYSAGPGYDQVTGLGSVDVYSLAAILVEALTSPN